MRFISFLYFFIGLLYLRFQGLSFECHSAWLAFGLYTTRVGPPMRGASLFFSGEVSLVQSLFF